MRIGIIGSGQVGRTLATGFANTGHDVRVGSRDPGAADLAAWSARSSVRCAGLAETAAHGEVVVLATAWAGTQNALELAGIAHCAGKLVIDATNPLRYTDRLELALGHGDSGGEQVQRWLPGARVVKAFNTVGWELMLQPQFVDGPPTLFICGDGTADKVQVAALAAALGWATHDAGPLSAARLTEPLALLWIEHAMRSGSRNHAFRLLTTAGAGARSVVEQFFGGFQRGDLGAVLAALADDVEYTVNTRHTVTVEALPWSKTFHGRDAVQAFFIDLMQEFEVLAFALDELVAAGDSVAAFGSFRYRARTTGQECVTDWSARFAVRDGHIVRYQFFEDSYAIARAFRVGGSWEIENAGQRRAVPAID